jgi:ribosome-associated translation inhibitor RaiA
MWMSILTKRCKLSPSMRQRVESHVRRAVRREQRQIGSIVLTISPTKLGEEPGYRCRLRIWSHYLGVIVVSEIGHTIVSTTQQATARVRHAVRRRLHKRLSRFRRAKGGRLASRFMDSALD